MPALLPTLFLGTLEPCKLPIMELFFPLLASYPPIPLPLPPPLTLGSSAQHYVSRADGAHRVMETRFPLTHDLGLKLSYPSPPCALFGIY